jgi:hypothetical protein
MLIGRKNGRREATLKRNFLRGGARRCGRDNEGRDKQAATIMLNDRAADDGVQARAAPREPPHAGMPKPLCPIRAISKRPKEGYGALDGGRRLRRMGVECSQSARSARIAVTKASG